MELSMAKSIDNKHDRPPRLRQIHWRAPTFMLGAFLAGLAFALGHHFFYKRLDGVTVKSNTQQQWVIRGGSAFAFCVKVLLVVSTGTAFAQNLWLSLSWNAHIVSDVDSMFAVLGNALKFANLKLWFKHPILFIIALFTW
jgi:hypothetical protein